MYIGLMVGVLLSVVSNFIEGDLGLMLNSFSLGFVATLTVLIVMKETR